MRLLMRLANMPESTQHKILLDDVVFYTGTDKDKAKHLYNALLYASDGTEFKVLEWYTLTVIGGVAITSRCYKQWVRE